MSESEPCQSLQERQYQNDAERVKHYDINETIKVTISLNILSLRLS